MLRHGKCRFGHKDIYTHLILIIRYLRITHDRFSSSIVLTFATALEAGTIASCIVMKSMLPFLMDVARGFPYYQSIGIETTEYTARQNILLGIIWIASSDRKSTRLNSSHVD